MTIILPSWATSPTGQRRGLFVDWQSHENLEGRAEWIADLVICGGANVHYVHELSVKEDMLLVTSAELHAELHERDGSQHPRHLL